MAVNNEDIHLLNSLEARFSQYFGLSTDDWQRFSRQGQLARYEKGQSVFHAGEIDDRVRIVCEGLLCNFYLTPQGTRRNKSFLQTGDISACLSSFAADLPARFSCEALGNTVCFEISAKAMQQLANESAGWRNAYVKMITALALKKEKREADLLLLSPTELYLEFGQTHPQLLNHLPNYHIASYLGITEVSLSRIRAKLGMQNRYQRQSS
uniref:Crp/Fnr family transcriptional regulator n=1 Tax=Thaumasiovibrio occultus TaxID=1891184 RepID=UPI000B356B91|nr:Crp/Fnr family transcriptional regulator [Thaumasiovibrio occultus]